MRIFLLGLLILFNLEAKPLFSNDMQAQSASYLESLKELLIATQKTRGLTNSYLNGNLISIMLVQDSRNDMKKALREMQSIGFSSDTDIDEEGSEIGKRLIRLNRKSFKLKSDEAFESYTKEIENILNLAKKISKKNLDHMSAFAQKVSSIMMEEILPLSEYIGRLRGLGSGIAARGIIQEHQREMLNKIIDEIKILSDTFEKKEKDIIKEDGKYYDDRSSDKVLEVRKSIDRYVSLAKEELCRESISLKPDEYFSHGTNIIMQIISLYDDNNKAILEDSRGWL